MATVTVNVKSLTVHYVPHGPHASRWKVRATMTGTVLAQAQCLEAAMRYAESIERTTLHSGIHVQA